VSNVLVVLAVVLVVSFVVRVVNRRRRGLVAERGMSVGADLGTMRDQPRVRVRTVTRVTPDRVRVVLAPDVDPADGAAQQPDLDLVVVLRDEDFGFELLDQWQQSQAVLAIVMPPGGRLVRLRSIDDLQPVTLRRADE